MRPEDIENKEFLVALRGYDRDEVREFLKQVAAELRSLVQSPPEEPTAGSAIGAQDLGGEIAGVVRSVITEAMNIRAQAERDAEQIRLAALEESAPTRLKRAINAIWNHPNEGGTPE